MRTILTALLMTLAAQSHAKDSIFMTCWDYERTYSDGSFHEFAAEFKLEDKALELWPTRLTVELDRVIGPTDVMLPSRQEGDTILYDVWQEPTGKFAVAGRLLLKFNLNNQKMDIVSSVTSVNTSDPDNPLHLVANIREGQLDCKRDLFDN